MFRNTLLLRSSSTSVYPQLTKWTRGSRSMPFRTPPSLEKAVTVVVSKIVSELKRDPTPTPNLETIRNGELWELKLKGFNRSSEFTVTADGAFQRDRLSKGNNHVSGIGIGIFDRIGRLIGAVCERIHAESSTKAEMAAIQYAANLANSLVRPDEKFKVVLRSDCSSLCKKKFNGYLVEYLPREVNQLADRLSKLAISHGSFDSTVKKMLPLSVLPLAYEASGEHYGARLVKKVVKDQSGKRSSVTLVEGYEDMSFPDISNSENYKVLFSVLDSALHAIISDKEGRKVLGILLVSNSLEAYAFLNVAIFKANVGKKMEMTPMLTRLHSLLRHSLPLKEQLKARILLDLAGDALAVPYFTKDFSPPVGFRCPSIKMDLGQFTLDSSELINLELIIKASEFVELPKKVLFPDSGYKEACAFVKSPVKILYRSSSEEVPDSSRIWAIEGRMQFWPQ